MQNCRSITVGVVVFVFIIIVIVVWVENSDQTLSYRAKRIKREDAALFITKNRTQYESRLKIGLQRSVAELILPAPNNANTGEVLLWSEEYEEARKVKDLDWKNMLLVPGKGCFFIVFRNGRIATPLLTSAADWDPWAALVKFQKMSEAEAVGVLGPKPK